MANYHNIEKSGFRAGEYVGYAGGHVYNIKRDGRGWSARKNAASGQPSVWFNRKTLREVSAKLETL